MTCLFPRTISRTILPLMAAATVVLVAGCTPRHRVQFETGAPYHVQFKSPDQALVAFPDSVLEREYKIRAGGSMPWEKRMYIIPVYDLYRAETLAHLNGFFTGGVTITSHSTLRRLDEARKEEAEKANEARRDPYASDPNSSLQPTSELDRVIADLTAKEKGEDVPDKTEEQLNEELFELIALEALMDRDPRYVIWFSDTSLIASGKRLLISFRAEVRDQRTKAVLLDQRYNGRTPPFEPGNNEASNKIRLQVMSRETMNGLMKAFINDLTDATDARR